MCMPCAGSDDYELKPIVFWSYEKWGLPTPCINHGLEHSEHVTLGEWRMRRVKGVSDDFYLAGRRSFCSLCKSRKDTLKAETERLEVRLMWNRRE